MKDINRVVCIAAHINDRDIAEDIKRALEGIGISSRIACGDNIEEQNVYAAICDAAVVVISENTETSPKGSVERVVNKLTGKTTVRYTAEEVEFSPSMQYYMQKTREFKAADGPEAFVQEMKKILEGIEIEKDILIAAEATDMESAEALKTEFEGRCCSCITAYNKEDFKNFLDRCYVIVLAGRPKDEGFCKSLNEHVKKSKTPLVAFEGDNENHDKKIEKTIKILAAKKPAVKTLSVNDTGKIKLMKKPYVPLILGFMLLQACVALVWLLSVMKQPLFIIPVILLIAGYIALLTVSGKKCSYTHCKEPHNGRKVNIAVFKKSREYTHYFCDKHNNINDVSTNKKRSLLMPALVSVVTVVFALFLIFAVEAEDFSILSIKQAFETLQKVEFADAGFEAFIRNEFNFTDDKITKADLAQKTVLILSAEHCTMPINSLEDIKYFPNLEMFCTLDVTEITGDIAVFKNTPKLEYIDMGRTNMYGDIAAFSELTEITIINAGWMEPGDKYFDRNIYGDINSLENLNKLKELALVDTKVTGDISVLSDKDLRFLAFVSSNVYGDIKELEKMDGLAFLAMDGLDVWGDVAALKNMMELEEVTLEDTDVSGDFSVFYDKEKLNILRLTNTKVTGDTSPFYSMENMMELLSNTVSFSRFDENDNGENGDLNIIPNMISSIVEGWHPLFGESSKDMFENNGKRLDAHDLYQDGDEWYELVFEKASKFTIDTPLDQIEGLNTNGNQAIHISFKTSNPNVFFSLTSTSDKNNELGFEFFEEGPPMFFSDGGKKKTAAEGEFEFTADQRYVIFMAIGKDGRFKGVVWEDGNARSAAYFEEALGGGYVDKSFKFAIGAKEPAVISIDHYTIYDFKDFK